MKTLDKHNAERREFHDQHYGLSPHKNGIECPKCQAELWDSNPMMTLTSNPPKKNIHCKSCDYVGYRLA